ncbi:MAG: DUF1993 domain-containing protein [Pseudomonadota bacterium]|nr:DUF1993 domain-containing protein [Pseudomonadota bacterium]
MSLYDASVPQLVKMLGNMERWLDKAAEHAAAKKFDVDTLLAARLAPDQYALVRQIQAACDAAKFAGARLAGKEAPVHPDTETTVAQLRARIQSVIAFLGTLTPADFDGAARRPVTLSFMPGMVIDGTDYLNELAIPNFYFHATTAYAILRHNGVNVGKSDFIGGMKLRPV